MEAGGREGVVMEVETKRSEATQGEKGCRSLNPPGESAQRLKKESEERVRKFRLSGPISQMRGSGLLSIRPC